VGCILFLRLFLSDYRDGGCSCVSTEIGDVFGCWCCSFMSTELAVCFVVGAVHV
jgi:hypothetical protein